MGIHAASCAIATDSTHDVGAPRITLVAHAGIALAAFLVFFARRPDAILNAQFYAEDGARWFAEAYHLGWRCLLIPQVGYLQTVPRLIGLLSLLFPFALAPLAMNLCALAVQILPVNLFLSSRFATVSFKTRLLGSLLYLSLPNSFEVHANTANVQWHLALAGCLLLLSRVGGGRAWRFLDLTIMAFSVLSGPAGMLLVPVAALLCWKRRDARSCATLVLLLPGAILQTLLILLSHTRRPAPNGASLERLTGILGGQVFFSSVMGLGTSIQLFFGHVHSLLLIQAIAMLVGLAITVYAFRYGPMELKLFIFYAALTLAVALIRPVASFSGEFAQWQVLQIPGVANRYYFLPMLAFLASLTWMVANTATSKPARYAALAVMALLPYGICRDWRYKPFVDFDFQGFAAAFERAAPGKTLSIPINPDWQMVLTKH
jgi:hypothetical protein